VCLLAALLRRNDTSPSILLSGLLILGSGRGKSGLGRVHTQLDMSFSEMDTDTTRALICFVERSCLGYGFVVCDGAGGIPDFDLR
jgi:hypothetical protein